MRSFDNVTKIYDLLELLAFGRSLSKSKVILLQHVFPRTRVLLIGEGTGKVLSSLKNFSSSDITVVEKSKRMVQNLRKNYNIKNVNIYNLDYFEYHTTRKYDLIYTTYFLDCFSFDDINCIVKLISKHILRGGIWVNVDFTVRSNSRMIVRTYMNFILKLLYFFFRRFTDIGALELPDHHRVIAFNGFEKTKQIVFPFPSITATCYSKSKKNLC